MKELTDLINGFQNSFNFYILKNNYGFSDSAKEFLNKYLSIKNHMYLDEQAKYEQLTELLKDSMNATLETMNSIKEINKLWNIDIENIVNDDIAIQNRLRSRTKIVCNSIQNIFENIETRKILSPVDLYNLYISYFQIMNNIKNKKITEQTLAEIESKLQSISDKVWVSSITNPEDFKLGESFKFIVHNISKTEMVDTTEFITRNTRVSASLITDKEMGLFGIHKYGMIYPSTSKIITTGYDDLQSYETSDGNEIFNSRNSTLITPQQIESYCVQKSLKENGKILNNDNVNIYNEVLLDSTNGLKPVGIYCITFGEKELSYDYVSAKELAKKTGLPLIDIDTSLYRTKNNMGSYLTDEESLSVKEQYEFAERFLKQYYKNKGLDLSTSQNFVEYDLELYKDTIVDIFLTQKKNNDINPNELFTLFEQHKNKRKTKAESYNTYINEMSDLVIALNDLNIALSTCNNEEIKVEIIKQSDEIVKRMQNLNRLIENTNSIGLSADNWIYQNNNISSEIMSDFTPFNFDQIEFNGNSISVITGYKSKEELEQVRQNMLEQVDLVNSPIEKRTEHAKRVIDVTLNAYKTNSVNIDVATYKQTNPELEKLKEKSSIFIDISALDKDLNNYDELVQLKDLLTSEITMLSNNRKIYDGASSIEWIEQNQKEYDDKINGYKSEINEKEQLLIELRQRQENLLGEKEVLDKKGFFKKMISNNVINENSTNLNEIRNQIADLEYQIDTVQQLKKSEEEYLKLIINNFLSNFALEGMSLEDYKKKLETILPNAYNLTDLSKQKELEEKLKLIEQKINEIQIDKDKEQQMKQTLEQKKIDVGLSNLEPIIMELPEEYLEEKTSNIFR